MARRKKYSSEWDLRLKELYENGMSFYEIYKKYAIHPQVVKDRIVALGAEIRDTDEAFLVSKRRRNSESKRPTKTGNDTSKRRNKKTR